jgi:putative tricarboxylic transport membrane protein
MKRALRGALASLMSVAALSLAAPSFAQEFPTRSVAIVIHTGPGGPFDTLARRVAELLNKDLGWEVRVENREGSNGVIALASVMRQPADGHTIIGIGNTTSYNIALEKTPYTLDDIEYLSGLQGEPSAVVVRGDSQLQTLGDYMQALKDAPDSLRVGGSGSASNAFVHFLLHEKAGMPSTWVPFTTAPEAVTALLGGHLDAVFMTPSTALAQIESGEFRMLATSSETRSELFPDVPTFSESGYDVDVFLWRGFGMKQGAPVEVVEAWKSAFDTIRADPEWTEMMATQKQEAYDVSGEALEAVAADEIEDLKRYYQSSGAGQ